MTPPLYEIWIPLGLIFAFVGLGVTLGWMLRGLHDA